MPILTGNLSLAVYVVTLRGAEGTAGQEVVQDTAGKVAYVAKPGGPPESGGYMWAGYAVALGLYLGYILLMVRRIARSRQQLAARGAGGDRPG